MRDYRGVDCVVAREALSARLDGEREPVPSARVDEHLAECTACRAWVEQITDQADHMRWLADSRPVIAAVGHVGFSPVLPRRRWRMGWQRWALLGVGIAQIVLACVQGLGLDVGLAHQHGMNPGGHLLNESTSWSVALGVVMVGAAVWQRAAAGLAGVLTAFVGVLTIFVVFDALSGAVTMARVLTHLPVVVGALLAALVSRGAPAPHGGPSEEVAGKVDIVLPKDASRGRRRGHLWPGDDSAA